MRALRSKTRVEFMSESQDSSKQKDSGGAIAPPNIWPLYLAGRCANGAERDGGTRWHAVPDNDYKALCGAKPGRQSAGWAPFHRKEKQAITCPACIRKLKNLPQSPKQTEVDSK